jgi:hypothetical protein
VRTLSPLFYVELSMQAGSAIDLDVIDYPERAVYVVEGNASIGDDTSLVPGDLAPFDREARVLRAETDVVAVMLGGAPLDGPDGGHRFAWWNFVSSSRERIQRATAQWRAREFPRIPSDDVEFV